MSKYKSLFFRIVSVFLVFLFLFAGFGVFSVSAAECTSFLDQPYYYLDSTEPIPYLSDFLALPYVNGNVFNPYDPTADATEYFYFRSFRPTPFNLSSPYYNFSAGSPIVGAPLGVNFALLYHQSDVNYGYPFSRDDLFTAPSGFIKVSCSFYSTQYFTSSVPDVYFLYFDDLDPNDYPDLYSPLFYVASDFIHFDLKCTRDKNTHPWTVTFNMYIPVEYMKSLDFSVMSFTLERNKAADSSIFNLSCKSLSVELVSDNDLPPISSEDPSLVPQPDPDVNQPFDDLESELNNKVDSYLEGDSSGESFDSAVGTHGGLFDDIVSPPDDPIFFDGDNSINLGLQDKFSFNPTNGMSFWSQILSAFLGLASINNLFKYSLSVGLFALLFGLVGSIASKAISTGSSSKRNNNDGGD